MESRTEAGDSSSRHTVAGLGVRAGTRGGGVEGSRAPNTVGCLQASLHQMSFAFPAKQQDGAGSGPKQAAKRKARKQRRLVSDEVPELDKRGWATWRPTNVERDCAGVAQSSSRRSPSSLAGAAEAEAEAVAVGELAHWRKQ